MADEHYSNHLSRAETERFLRRRGFEPDAAYVTSVWQALQAKRVTADQLDDIGFELQYLPGEHWPEEGRAEDATAYPPDVYLNNHFGETPNTGGTTISDADAEQAVRRDAVAYVNGWEKGKPTNVGQGTGTERTKLMESLIRNLTRLDISAGEFMRQVHASYPQSQGQDLFAYCADTSKEACCRTKDIVRDMASTKALGEDTDERSKLVSRAMGSIQNSYNHAQEAVPAR